METSQCSKLCFIGWDCFSYFFSTWVSEGAKSFFLFCVLNIFNDDADDFYNKCDMLRGRNKRILEDCLSIIWWSSRKRKCQCVLSYESECPVNLNHFIILTVKHSPSFKNSSIYGRIIQITHDCRLPAGRLQSMGSRRVGHDWATSLSLFIFMHWRRK